MIQLNYEYIIPFATYLADNRVAADSLPTAILYRNGAASGVTVVVSTTAVTGKYNATFTTDAGWAKTDRLYLDVSAVIDGETKEGMIWDSFNEPDAVMRGTDGANTVAPDNAGIAANGVAIAAKPTAVQVRQEMDTNSTQLAAIKTKTDTLPAVQQYNPFG